MSSPFGSRAIASERGGDTIVKNEEENMTNGEKSELSPVPDQFGSTDALAFEGKEVNG